jgi:phenylpropionate dioxygenase-like ring-hydroxylating dioxygenase large terminal subunit
MIRNQWYVVLESNEVKSGPAGVTRLGERLVFWRGANGKLGCVADCCAHRGVELSIGKVIEHHLQCPFHGFEYDASGRVTKIPANGAAAPVPAAFHVQSYPVHEEHGLVWIWWGTNPPTNLKPPRFFDDLDDSFSSATAHDPWRAHYSRVIENQLDTVHLPFVHHNTIGRGGRTLVDGPAVKWIDEDMFYVYPHNRVDDGSAPLKPSEVPVEPEPPFKLEFIFPNLWQNYISPAVRIVGAFVPVDDDNTILYLRSYQKFMRIPILRPIVDAIFKPSNIYIAHQDRRIVETHQPKASALRSDEHLIRGDFPIIEYRRRRQQLKQAALTEGDGR